ncbi:hypothetical protein HK105_208144 [Polyrhizophydium stewartii]|uniref:Uncharacterized protein n=1 Tax=Polyrhizophydium stewartii TaxID=2732419 RepID=A0ABR4MYQ8_9FUNG|nr:hypothetical protein HK105_001415 [Polyrhizophydium stewartii]
MNALRSLRLLARPLVPAAAAAASRTALPAAFAGTALVQPAAPAGARSVYNPFRKPPIIKSKFEVEVEVLSLLHDYVSVDESKVTMNANLIHDLLIDSLDRYGFYTELLEKFEIDVPFER